MKPRMRPGLAFTTLIAALAAGCASAPRPLPPPAHAQPAAGVEALGRGGLDSPPGQLAAGLGPDGEGAVDVVEFESPCDAATGPAPRSAFTPRSPSTKISRRLT